MKRHPPRREALVRAGKLLALAVAGVGAVMVERERSRRVQSARESVFRAIIEGATDPIYVKDLRGRYVLMNAATARAFGAPTGALMGKDNAALRLPAEEVRAIREVEQEVLRTGQPRTMDMNVTIAGRTGVFHCTKAPYRDPAGNLRGIIGIAWNMTEHKAEELARARLAAIVESTADAVIGMTLDGTVTSWNAAAERIYGYVAAEILGRPIAAVVLPSERSGLGALFERVGRGERVQNLEGVLLRKDGEKIDTASTLSPIRDATGAVVGISKITRDVTRQKRAAQERAELLEREQAARAEAQAATRAKDTFLAKLSHELRTPLQSILGWTQILRRRELDAIARRGLASIERNVNVQAQLIEDLLDVSRIVAGKLRLEEGRVDLVRVVDAALDSARLSAQAKSIRMDVRLDRSVSETAVKGDPQRLQQVVSNLLTNAVKFTPRGGLIGVTLARRAGSAILDVEDTGCGISPDLLPHVFERFRQASDESERTQSGLGLGLEIVHDLVEMHGGTVTAASPGEGQGSTFTVTLPLVSARAVGGPAPREAREESGASDERDACAPGKPRAPPSLAGVRVLVVDDDPDACELLELVLRDAGADVLAAQSANEAIEKLGSFHPGLVISNLGMPGGDGYALIHQIRAREATATGASGASVEGRIPAVALTGFASSGDRRRALASGFDEYIAKPASPEEIARRVAGLVKRAA